MQRVSSPPGFAESLGSSILDWTTCSFQKSWSSSTVVKLCSVDPEKFIDFSGNGTFEKFSDSVGNFISWDLSQEKKRKEKSADAP